MFPLPCKRLYIVATTSKTRHPLPNDHHQPKHPMNPPQHQPSNLNVMRHQVNRHRIPNHRRRMLLEHPRRRISRLGRHVPIRKYLLETAIRVYQGIHRPRDRNKMRQIKVLVSGWQRRRPEGGILQDIRGRGGLRRACGG